MMSTVHFVWNCNQDKYTNFTRIEILIIIIINLLCGLHRPQMCQMSVDGVLLNFAIDNNIVNCYSNAFSWCIWISILSVTPFSSLH